MPLFSSYAAKFIYYIPTIQIFRKEKDKKCNKQKKFVISSANSGQYSIKQHISSVKETDNALEHSRTKEDISTQHRVVITVLTLQARPRICRLDPGLHRLLTQTAHPELRTLRSYRAMIGWGFMLVYNRKTIRGLNAMPFSADLTLRNFSYSNIFTGQKKMNLMFGCLFRARVSCQLSAKE